MHPVYKKLILKLINSETFMNDKIKDPSIVFNQHFTFDLSDNTMPILQTTSMEFAAILRILLKILSGKPTTLMPHSLQWRSAITTTTTATTSATNLNYSDDQIRDCINLLRLSPKSTNNTLITYDDDDHNNEENAETIGAGGQKPNLSTLFHLYINHHGRLSGSLYQCKANAITEIPFYIAFYSLLIHLLAKICNLKPGTFFYSVGIITLYKKDTTMLYLTEHFVDFPKILLNFTLDVTFNNSNALSKDDDTDTLLSDNMKNNCAISTTNHNNTATNIYYEMKELTKAFKNYTIRMNKFNNMYNVLNDNDDDPNVADDIVEIDTSKKKKIFTDVQLKPWTSEQVTQIVSQINPTNIQLCEVCIYTPELSSTYETYV